MLKSQSEWHMLLDIMDDHGLEQLIHFLLVIKSPCPLFKTWFLLGQFQGIHSPDKLSDHDCFSVFLRIWYAKAKKRSSGMLKLKKKK